MREFEKPYAAGMPNEQQFNQISRALYSYCKVMREPKMGPAPALITIFSGLGPTLLFLALGVSLLTAVAIGASLCALFAFLFWLAYRYRSGASKRLNSFLAEDGGRMMINDFAFAQPCMNDQFRLGRYFLYIRNGAVIRIDSIADIVKIVGSSGAYSSISVKDENGSMTCPLCRLHMLNAEAELYEIRQAVMQRKMSR